MARSSARTWWATCEPAAMVTASTAAVAAPAPANVEFARRVVSSGVVRAGSSTSFLVSHAARMLMAAIATLVPAPWAATTKGAKTISGQCQR